MVLGDAAQLRQVLLNLVGNAVKFTQNGRITVQVIYPAGQGLTRIIVHDSGIGIEPDNMDRIFEDFVTLDPTYARKAAGTGLGLGIVRRIVTRMGGTIDLESASGQGSTFRISLPLTFLDDAGPQDGAIPTAAPSRSLNLLVVEDNEFNRLIIRDMLVQDGHAVTEAESGVEGVAEAAAMRFDAILMDISMPGMDGLAAAERIRAGRGASKTSPIVALTAHALPEETDRFRADGRMQDVLTKPVTREMLRAVLARLPFWAVQNAHGAHAPGLRREALIDLEVWSQVHAALGALRAQELAARFVSDTDRRMADLVARSGEPGSEVELIGDVHRLSGSAAMFGAAAFHARLLAIEDLCKRGDKPAARAELPGLVSVWHDTAQAYRAGGSLAQASSLR